MLITFHQLESGLSKSILWDLRKYDHLPTEKWVTKLVKSLVELEARIVMDHWVQEIDGEEKIMDEVVDRVYDWDMSMKFNLFQW